MLGQKKILRLLLGVTLGLAFFGCVGLPRRRPPLEAPRRPLAGQRRPARPPQAVAPGIPADPTPAQPDVVPASAEGPAHPGPPPPPAPGPAGPPVDPPAGSPPPARQTGPPAVSPAPPTEGSLAVLRQLHQAAAARLASMDSCIVRLTRREFIKGKYQPEEVLLFKFRREPFSVYFKWVGPVGKGREVVYVKGRHENKIHTLLAAGDMPFAPAGKRIALAPDSVLVRSSSRHSIAEAGLGSLVDRFGAVLDALERGDTTRGTLNYLGPQQRPEFADPLDAVEWRLPPGADPTLPRGGKRWCFVDRDSRLPVLIVTHDERGQEVEHYRYDRFQVVPLDDDDFDPDKLWGRPRGRP